MELTAETDLEFYRRKQNTVTVRHVTGDRIVAVVEIVSRGNKSSNIALRALVDKAVEFLFQGVHLLVIDLHAPGPRDPHGIHGVIWEDFTGQVYSKPGKPLTLAAYEAGPAGVSTRAYVQPVSVGDDLPAMPLFLNQALMCRCRLTRPTSKRLRLCPDAGVACSKHRALGARAARSVR